MCALVATLCHQSQLSVTVVREQVETSLESTLKSSGVTSPPSRQCLLGRPVRDFDVMKVHQEAGSTRVPQHPSQLPLSLAVKTVSVESSPCGIVLILNWSRHFAVHCHVAVSPFEYLIKIIQTLQIIFNKFAWRLELKLACFGLQIATGGSRSKQWCYSKCKINHHSLYSSLHNMYCLNYNVSTFYRSILPFAPYPHVFIISCIPHHSHLQLYHVSCRRHLANYEWFEIVQGSHYRD